MIQFNLLPDVKLQYIKAQRVKHTVVTISFLAGAAALALFLFLLVTVKVVQTKLIDSKTSRIAKMTDEINKTPNLSKMLTVQGQLNRLTELHDGKPVTARLFDYMNKLTPTTVSISQLTVDMETKTINATGSGTSLDAVNGFTDSLKFTTYTLSNNDQPAKNAFSGVVLTSINRDTTKATFSVDFTFDEAIFSNGHEVELRVNKTVADQAAAVIIKR